MRILILDDNPHRHKVLAGRFSDAEIISAHKFLEFEKKLIHDGPWDLLHLDHDLNDFQDADTHVNGFGKTVPFDGIDAAGLVIEQFELGKFKGRVIVHSVNMIGAKMMVDGLTRFEVPAVWEMFDEDLPVDEDNLGV